MKCKIIEEKSYFDLERAIQKMLDNGKTISNISMSTTKAGYEWYYTAIVIYS